MSPREIPLLEARRRSRETGLVDAATEQGFGEMIDAILSNARRALTDIAVRRRLGS